MAGLETELREELVAQADREMVRRSVAGSWTYFVVLFATWCGTRYPTDYPVLFYSLAAAWCLVGAGRLLVARFHRQYYPTHRALWKRCFWLVILATPVVWGLFTAFTWVLYEQSADPWTAALVLMIAAGVSAGATSAFNPHLRLVTIYQLLLWVPPIATFVATGYYIEAVSVTIYAVYVVLQGREQSERFWKSLRDNALLRVRTRQLEQSHQIRDEFLAIVTHDLKNAIQGVLMSAYMLNKGLTEEELDEASSQISQSARYMAGLTTDLHDLARLGLKAIKLEPREIDLKDMVRRVVLEQEPQARERGIELRVSPEPTVRLNADPLRLRQILTNLISNAVKYNRDGGWVEVRWTVEGGRVALEVQDSGNGIAPEERERVFELFSRLGDGSGKVEGSGLGLAITRQLVELHQGDLELQSMVGEGSTFRVKLPGPDLAPSVAASLQPAPA